VSAGAPPQLSEEDLLVPAARPTLGKRLRMPAYVLDRSL